MNDIQMMKEGLIQLFSDDPIVWGKWLLVFAAFVLTFVVRIKFNIDEKFKPSRKLDEKVKKAIEKKHIINAKLIKRYPFDRENDTCSGKYEYEIDGKKYTYTALFRGRYPRRILHLFYEDDPKKVFTNEEYNPFDIFKALPSLILAFSPFLVGAFMVWILGLAN